MATHGLPITPVTVMEASISLSDGVYSHKIRYPPLHYYKPPLTSGATFSTVSPQFQTFAASSSSADCGDSLKGNNDDDLQQLPEPELEPESETEPNLLDADGIEVEIEKVSSNSRRIRSKVAIDASLETIWSILTDYERLADVIPSLVVSEVLDKRKNFARLLQYQNDLEDLTDYERLADVIPSLVVSEVLDKRTNFARLLQIGQQKLAFGLKFSAKGIVDCYEQDFETLPNGQRRDIEFKMIEGDFELFEGKWSIEQYEQSASVADQQCYSTLFYTVEVKPRKWLPVQLVEGRISREIQMNLFSIREEARKISDSISSG